MKSKFLFSLLAVFALSTASAAEYKIDVAHSSVSFKIKHLIISTVNGNFSDFSGTINFDQKKPKNISINGKINARSISTNNVKRDKHLRSKDFFDVEKFPNIVFTSKGVKKFKRGKGILMGEFTMHGVTKKVNLDFKVIGTTSDPYGHDKAVFEASGKLNRKDYNISWGDTLDNGGAVVGDEVKFVLNIEADKIKVEKKEVQAKTKKEISKKK